MPHRFFNLQARLMASVASLWMRQTSVAHFRNAMFVLAVVAAGAGAAVPGKAAEKGNNIVIIGGPWTDKLGNHDWPHGVQFITEMLKQSPQMASYPDLKIDAHPYGWPSDEALRHAATIVLYFSGDENNPLLDSRKRDIVAALMERGVGLVALHQSFTLPEGNTSVPMKQWLGGVRYGMYDRTTKPATLVVGGSGNPVARGLQNFVHFDEFYPTLEFNTSGGKLTPIWSSELPVQYLHGAPTVSIPPKVYDVAWAYERENGGRSFAYSGGHFLESWDDAQARTALLNAIVWTAGKDVPGQGMTTNVAPDAASKLAFPSGVAGRMSQAVVSRPEDYQIIEEPWGRIEWYVSGLLGNSQSLTFGLATIFPGKENPVHFHPNCSEVLHVLRGKILHSMNGVTVEMSAGDTDQYSAGSESQREEYR